MHYDSERVRCIKIYGAIKKDLSDDTGRNVYIIPIMKIKIHVEMSSASFECLKKLTSWYDTDCYYVYRVSKKILTLITFKILICQTYTYQIPNN